MKARSRPTQRGIPTPTARGEAFRIVAPGVNYGIMNRLLGSHLRRAQILVYEDFFKAVEGSEITPPLFASLILIKENPGMSQGVISTVLGIAKSGAMSLVDKLEALKLVERRPHPENRRSKSLHLTAAGHRELKLLEEAVEKFDLHASRNLTKQERETLLLLLRKLDLPTRTDSAPSRSEDRD
ncbi:MarR family transcriptional regulator [Ruegeria pomeroyi]|nr:MarR family transcriptional regulator [Ruegeria pomeroyi]